MRIALNVCFIVWIGALAYGGAAPRVNDALDWLHTHGHWAPQGRFPAIWFLHWQMFQHYAPKHSQAFFEGLRPDGIWVPIDHRKLFRYRYDSGLRFERPDVWRSRRHQVSLAQYVCQRHRRRYPAVRVDRVRLGRRTWPKRPGRADQEPGPNEQVRTRILYEGPCSAD
jgi:hypothetical protein